MDALVYIFIRVLELRGDALRLFGERHRTWAGYRRGGRKRLRGLADGLLYYDSRGRRKNA